MFVEPCVWVLCLFPGRLCVRGRLGSLVWAGGVFLCRHSHKCNKSKCSQVKSRPVVEASQLAVGVYRVYVLSLRS